MVQVTLLEIRGHAAIVTYRDKEGMLQGRIISRDDVLGVRVRETKSVPDRVIDTGTEYGIDLEIILGEKYVITPDDLAQELRRHGVWTYDDMNKKPGEVVAAINSTRQLTATAQQLLHELTFGNSQVGGQPVIGRGARVLALGNVDPRANDRAGVGAPEVFAGV